MLRFSLKFGDKLEAIIKAAQEEGDEIPESIRNAPVLNPRYEFCWRCFCDVSFDRPNVMGELGPIPWSSIKNYCEAYGVMDEIGVVSRIVRKVDDFYCEENSKKVKAKVNGLRNKNRH